MLAMIWHVNKLIMLAIHSNVVNLMINHPVGQHFYGSQLTGTSRCCGSRSSHGPDHLAGRSESGRIFAQHPAISGFVFPWAIMDNWYIDINWYKMENLKAIDHVFSNLQRFWFHVLDMRWWGNWYHTIQNQGIRPSLAEP